MVHESQPETVVVTGRVLDERTVAAAGIPGVAVSDGVSVTRTDAQGRYRLTVDLRRRHTSLVHITVPSGWRAPLDDCSAPAFYRRVGATTRGRAGDAKNVDFRLSPDPLATAEEYRFVAMADVHVQAGTDNTRENCRRQFGEINRLLDGYADDAGPPRFVTVAGDLTNVATKAEFADYLAAMAGSRLPVWSAPGNHDLTNRPPGGPQERAEPQGDYRDIIDAYRQSLGPEWYSFQYGRRHFVILENYRGLPERDQLAWLRRDLATNADGKQIVVISHVPWDVPQTPRPSHTSAYLELFRQYDVRLLLAGHTHANDVRPGLVGRAVQAVTTSAAYALDQTPRGFRVVEFGDRGPRLRYGEFEADRRATVVYPAGRIARPPDAVRVSHYAPPGAATQVEYRLPLMPWRPLRPVGSRAWVAELDPAGQEAPAGPAEAGVRLRLRDDQAAPWAEQSTSFQVVPELAAVRPRQGAPWPMFHGDARHTGVSADEVRPPLTLAWARHSGGTVLTSSAAVAGGTVFIGVRDENGDGGDGVAAFDLATGEPRWRAGAPGAVEASMAVHDDGTGGAVVLAPSVKGPLRALDAASGAVRWQWAPDHAGAEHSWMYFSPTVADGVVYQAYSVASGAWVVAVDASTGEPRWRTGEPIGRNWISHGSPAVAGDRLYFATAYANLVALDATSGRVRWQSAFGGWTRSMPVLAGGLVLLACQGDRLVAVDAESGSERWRYQSGGRPLLPGQATAATPAVAGGVVYAGFADGSLAALGLDDGEPRWRQRTGGAVISSPAISGDHLYVGGNDGLLRAVDRHSGECDWSHDLGCWVASSPAVTGNAVVVAAWDGTVYAFTAGSPIG